MSDSHLPSREEAANRELHGLHRELILRDLAKEPDNWSLLADLALVELTFGRYQEAAAAIDRAEALCPPKAKQWLLSRRGDICKARCDLRQAQKYYLAAHKLDREEATFLIFAASSASMSGNRTQAFKWMTMATKCSKGCIEEAWFNLGSYWMAEGNYPKAKSCYLKALQLDPNYELAKKRLEDISKILTLPRSRKSVRPSGSKRNKS